MRLHAHRPEEPPVSSHTPSLRSDRAVRRLVVPLAAVIGTTFGAVLYGFSVLITAGGAGGEFSTALLSTAYGGAVVTGGLVAVPVGRWTGARGIRGVLAVGGALVAAGFAGFAAATEPWQVLVAWLALIGPGSAMTMFDPAFVVLEQWCDRAQRNRAAGTLTLTTGLAGPVFVPVVTAAMGAWGWRQAAWALGATVAGVAWLCAAVALRHAPRPGARTNVSAPSTADATHAGGVRTSGRGPAWLRSPRFWAVTVAVGLLCAAMDAIQVHRIAVFEARGFAPAWLAALAAGASLASLPGRVIVPRLATRHGGVPWLLAAAIVLVGAHAAAIAPADTWQAAAHFGLFGVAFGAALSLRAVVMGDWWGASTSYGAMMGVQAMAIAAGRALGPWATGWSASALGGYDPAMVALTAAVAVSAALIAISPRLRP